MGKCEGASRLQAGGVIVIYLGYSGSMNHQSINQSINQSIILRLRVYTAISMFYNPSH
jgi:hypothetical protein